jgi:hypothetical protein
VAAHLAGGEPLQQYGEALAGAGGLRQRADLPMQPSAAHNRQALR